MKQRKNCKEQNSQVRSMKEGNKKLKNKMLVMHYKETRCQHYGVTDVQKYMPREKKSNRSGKIHATWSLQEYSVKCGENNYKNPST